MPENSMEAIGVVEAARLLRDQHLKEGEGEASKYGATISSLNAALAAYDEKYPPLNLDQAPDYGGEESGDDR